jgi:hypothetical protein
MHKHFQKKTKTTIPFFKFLIVFLILVFPITETTAQEGKTWLRFEGTSKVLEKESISYWSAVMMNTVQKKPCPCWGNYSPSIMDLPAQYFFRSNLKPEILYPPTKTISPDWNIWPKLI